MSVRVKVTVLDRVPELAPAPAGPAAAASVEVAEDRVVVEGAPLEAPPPVTVPEKGTKKK